MEFARDLAIIIVAVESFVAIAVSVALIWKVMRLVDTLRAEVPELMASARRTVDTVQGTASFMGRNVAMPVIKVASVAAAATRFAQVMMGSEKPRRR